MSRATTTADILRDADTTDSDGFGDPTETAGPPVAEGVPFAIVEKNQRAVDPTSGTATLVTYYVGRCSGLLDVRVGDRIKDRKDGRFYGVAAVSQPENPVRVLDKRLELSRV